MKTVLNTNVIDTLKQPLFLGEGLSLQRYDRCKYEIFLNLFKKQLEFFWRPEEINLTKDRSDFKKLSDNEKFIFTSNLKFQTMMDSVIARGLPNLSQYISNPELEACTNVWAVFETLHSYSYTYLIQNVFADPSLLMDSILEDQEILKRAKSVTTAYDALNKKFKEEKDLRKQIYLTLISINVLEAVRFYVSFACALAFEQNQKMCGNAKIIELIRRDEGIHMFITQNIIKILREQPSEGFQDVIADCRDDAIAIFMHAAQEEKEWASYLFKDGGLIGLNEKIMHQYIEWLTDTRLDGVGLPKQFGTKNPIGWLEMNSAKKQVAPQEQEVTSYKVAASVNDVNQMDFDFLDN
jgi:ribonucleoside-diphosphate reductase beta chain